MVKQVLVVRKDLNMRKGKIAAQCAHASMASLLKYKSVYPNDWSFEDMPEAMYEWLDGPFTKIVVSVNSEEELLALKETCHDNGMPCSLIRDAGHTEFHGVATNTVLAVGPEDEDKINKITGHLALL